MGMFPSVNPDINPWANVPTKPIATTESDESGSSGTMADLVKHYSENPEEAKQILAKHGVPDQDTIQKVVGGGAAPTAPDAPAATPPTALGSQGIPDNTPKVQGMVAQSWDTEADNRKREQLKAEDEFKNNSLKNRKVQWTPAQIQAQFDAYGNTPEAQNVQGGIANLQDMLNMQQKSIAGQSRLDLSPLMAEADRGSLNPGTNILAGYKAPLSLSEANKPLLDLAEKIQGKREDYFKSLVAAAKGDNAGYNSDDLVQLSKTLASIGIDPAKMGNPNAGAMNTLNLLGKMNSDSDVKNFKQKQDAANSIMSLTDSNLSTQAMIAKIELLKASGLGRITQLELAQAGDDPSAANRLQGLMTRLFEGQITDQNKKEMQGIAKILGQGAQEQVQGIYQKYHSAGAAANVPSSTIDKMLNIGGPRSGPKAVGNSPASKTPSPEPTVRIVDPAGKIRLIPKSQVDDAIKAGGKMAT